MLTDLTTRATQDERETWSTPSLTLLKMRDYLNRGVPLHDSGTLILLKVGL